MCVCTCRNYTHATIVYFLMSFYDAFAPQSLENIFWTKRTLTENILCCLLGSFWIYHKWFYTLSVFFIIPDEPKPPFPHSVFLFLSVFSLSFSHSLSRIHFLSGNCPFAFNYFCYLQTVNWVRQNCVAKCGEWQRLINNHKADSTLLQVYWHCISKP